MANYQSKDKINLPRKSGVKVVKINVSAHYVGQDEHNLTFIEKFYFEEEVEVPNPMFGVEENATETVTAINTTVTEENKIIVPMAKIDQLFQAYGTSIYKTKGYAQGIIENFEAIHKVMLISSGAYGVTTWIKK